MPTIILTKLFRRFLKSEQSAGIILMFCTAFSLVLTNTIGEPYTRIWEISLSGHTFVHWINDGLMTAFLLLVGLELKRELYIGELSSPRNALLPVFAALGGMLIPAAIFMSFNREGPAASGAGIPMATDIAFALGVLSLLGSRVPSSLKIFLTALAVIDDLGAIIVIAIFYTSNLDTGSFATAIAIFLTLLMLNRLRVNSLIPYLIAGMFMWYYMSLSGVHATITGVLLAFAIPFGSGGENTPSYRLESMLHIPVAYFVLPLFALANTCILIDGGSMETLGTFLSIGIMAGLFFGKPLGILLFSYVATALNISSMPPELKWSQVAGAGILAGIGFTMCIFITLLAYEDKTLVDASKLSIMAASLIAGIAGIVWLRRTLSYEPAPAKSLSDESQ